MSVDEAVDKIKGPAKVNEVLPEVAPEDKSKVFNALRMQKATEPQLKKQAMPMGGSPAGMETQPATVQTSAQTAMTKADLPDDFYSKITEELAPQKTAESKEDSKLSEQRDMDSFENQFSEDMKYHKKQKNWLTIAQNSLDYAGLAEKKGDLETAKKWYKTAKKYFNEHLLDSNPTLKEKIGSSPRVEEQQVERKLAPETRQKFMRQEKEAQRILRGPTSMSSTTSKNPITEVLFGRGGPKFLRETEGKNSEKKSREGWEGITPSSDENLSSRERKKSDAIKRFKELTEKFRNRRAPKETGVEDAKSEFTEGFFMPEAHALRVMDEEFEQNNLRPRTRSEKQELQDSIDSQRALATTTERKFTNTPNVGSDVPPPYITPQADEMHRKMLQARAGAKTGIGHGEKIMTEDENQVAQRNRISRKIDKERRQKQAKKQILPVTEGGAQELAARIAAEEARRKQALAAKQAQSTIPSASDRVTSYSAEEKAKMQQAAWNEAMAAEERKEREAKKSLQVSFEKSAEQAKNPAFPKPGKKGSVAGNIPESDVIGNYSKKMSEQDTINNKPIKKQGFGSAAKLKALAAKLKNK